MVFAAAFIGICIGYVIGKPGAFDAVVAAVKAVVAKIRGKSA